MTMTMPISDKKMTMNLETDLIAFEDLIPVTTITNEDDLNSAMVTDDVTNPSMSSTETSTTSPTVPNQNAMEIVNLLAQLKEKLSGTIDELLDMTSVQLNDIMADHSTVQHFTISFTAEDQPRIGIPQLLEALNSADGSKIEALLLGFASVLDPTQDLSLSDVQNFVAVHCPILRTAIEQIISERDQNTAVSIDNFEQTLANIYTDGLATFAPALNDFKLKEFNEIGPDAGGNISTDQLIAYASQMLLVTDDDIRQMCLMADPDGNGKISYERFSSALNAQYLAKRLLTALFENVPENILENIPENVQSFVSKMVNDTAKLEMFSGDVISDEGILALDSPQSEYTPQLHDVHKGHGHYHNQPMIVGALLVFVMILVVFIMLLMRKGLKICKRRRRYVKTFTASEVGSEDELIMKDNAI